MTVSREAFETTLNSAFKEADGEADVSQKERGALVFMAESFREISGDLEELENLVEGLSPNPGKPHSSQAALNALMGRVNSCLEGIGTALPQTHVASYR